MKNKEFARITKTRKTFLEVKKVDIEIPEKDTDGKLMIESIIIDQDDLKLSEDNNLYNRYVIAVNLLLS
jgi:hypothetical protein